MRKKIFFIIAFMLLILSILILEYGLMKKGQIQTNEETLQNEILEVMSIDENDPRIIGYLTIEELEIEKAPIADGTDTETLDKYIGHFENTSYLEGNVCLCSHNRGNKAIFFQNLKDAKRRNEN
ncbi:MAG: hypothetical protein Q4G09_07035 [Clostridia bacterium]|nr:hypothetical protein [Clostridia bacterium]